MQKIILVLTCILVMACNLGRVASSPVQPGSQEQKIPTPIATRASEPIATATSLPGATTPAPVSITQTVGPQKKYYEKVKMNELLQLLLGGNLQSDGAASDVADDVIRNPELLDELVDGLFESEDLIRGRTAHALERISRSNPEMISKLLPKLMEIALNDQVLMVKWHFAMIFGNLPHPEETVDEIISILLKMLEDKSVFVKSWALVSLTILGKEHRNKRNRILKSVRHFSQDSSISVRSKVSKVIKILENDNEPIPAGWLKSNGR